MKKTCKKLLPLTQEEKQKVKKRVKRIKSAVSWPPTKEGRKNQGL